MKIAQQLQKYVKNIGCDRPKNGKVFNQRNVFFVLILVAFFTMSTTFIVFNATTFQEYSLSFFVWITLFAMIIGFLTMLILSPEMFPLLDAIENSIDAS